SGRRLAGEELWRTAEAMLDPEGPGDFNQAMMELGATVCTPRAPACLTCPVVELCATRGELAGSAKAQRQKKREINYALVLGHEHGRDGAVLLVRRPRDASLMAGMWELPEVDATAVIPPPKRVLHRRFAPVRNDKEFLFTLRHSITVTDYTVQVWRRASTDGVRGNWIPKERLQRMALTGLARKILRKAEIL
ncbi:MAG TPA: NUDIX domain-containing protein, partial [Methylomirabilota bacterium]|nr:NUDIX domain-containing protein [Methylomirabilota bacterium]